MCRRECCYHLLSFRLSTRMYLKPRQEDLVHVPTRAMCTRCADPKIAFPQVQNFIDAGVQQGPYQPSPLKSTVSSRAGHPFGTPKRKREREELQEVMDRAGRFHQLRVPLAVCQATLPPPPIPRPHPRASARHALRSTQRSRATRGYH